MKPRISVIIPYYNRPEKLLRALKSVYKQTRQPDTVIVVDDASEILPMGLDAFPKVRLVHLQQNSGPGAARNKGLEESTGDFVAFLDCDDYWHPDFLDKLEKRLIEAPDLVMSYAITQRVHAGVNTAVRDIVKSNTCNILPEIFIDRRPWDTSGCLWNRNKISGVKWPETHCWEDYAFDVRCAVKANKVGKVPLPLLYYEVEGEDKLSNSQSIYTEIEKVKSLLDIDEVISNSEFTKNLFLRNKIESMLLSALRKMIENRETKMAESLLKNLEKYRGRSWVSFTKRMLSISVFLTLKIVNRAKYKVQEEISNSNPLQTETVTQ
ncbi:glycosyltransferase family 2 protein [Flavobacteriaceae bacterium M23B6Z8]